jgi:CRP-like cAMP-binding protein
VSEKTATIPSTNRLLAALQPADLALLEPHLTAVTLALRCSLETPNQPIEDIYFLGAGIASVVAVQSNDTRVEIGLIGREGMSGASVLLGNGQSPHSTYIQAIGAGWRMPAGELRKAVRESASLQRILLKYVQSFMVQTAHTAIANARAKLPERLARWILMAQDRMSGDTLVLTHEFLGLMLAVRRAGVTEALQNLQSRQFIRAQRGMITVLDREGLRGIAGDFYGLPEQEYRRLIG